MSLSSLKGKIIGYDTETTGLNPWNSRIYREHGMYPARPFAFALRDLYGNKAYIRWEVDPKTRKVLRIAKDIRALSAILGDPSIVKVGHNLAFDIRMSRMVGIEFDWTRIHDTAILAHVLLGGVSGVFSFGLKPLAKDMISFPDGDERELMDSVREARGPAKDKGWKVAIKETHGDEYTKSDMWLAKPELVEKYGCNDVIRCLGIFQHMLTAREEEPALWDVYKKTEVPLIRTVYKMEKAGIRSYPEKTTDLRKFYEDYVAKWRAKADKQGGKGVNFNSPKQLVNVFIDGMKLEVKSITKTGQPSIDADQLLIWSSTVPLAKSILECKAGQSMISKFLNSYDRFRTWNTPSLVHPSYHQTGARTARFSCSDPNFQQLASPDSVKKKADIPLRPREAFGPRNGNFWYMPDYSQMEVWNFAFAAQDQILMKALLAGLDIHEVVGKYICMEMGTLIDWKPGKNIHRKRGKTVMFLKQYGGGAGAYMEFMGCTNSEAWKVLKAFDKRFPGVDKFIYSTTEQIKKTGYIENPFGRIAAVDRSMAYTGVNYLIQGTCADIMKRAMNRIDNLCLFKYSREAKIVLTVHDELAIEAPKRLLKSDLCDDIIKAMQVDSKLVGLPVPLPVEMKLTTTTWADAKEIKI